MRRYETVFISDPDVQSELRDALFARAKEIIVDQFNGEILDFDEWGVKKLAYEINKKPRGFYVKIEYCAKSEAVDELERFFRIDDKVMKYMTIILEKDADVEALKEEFAQKNSSETADDSEGAETATEDENTEDEEDQPDNEEAVNNTEGDE